jgi:hypothetical protein
MAIKPQLPQPQTPGTVQERDNFQTPRYATDLLVPFIPTYVRHIWEPACGDYRMVNALEDYGYHTAASDLKYGWDFLNSGNPGWAVECIITNPPYSLKQKFYKKCMEWGVPFALLIPADYNGWIIDAIRKDGCEKIIPTRRINSITPNMAELVWKGQMLAHLKVNGAGSYKRFKDIPDGVLKQHRDCVKKYPDIDSISAELIAKYSSAQFHSMWLTHGFNLGRTETFVDLSKEDLLNV